MLRLKYAQVGSFGAHEKPTVLIYNRYGLMDENLAANGGFKCNCRSAVTPSINSYFKQLVS